MMPDKQSSLYFDVVGMVNPRAYMKTQKVAFDHRGMIITNINGDCFTCGECATMHMYENFRLTEIINFCCP